MVLCVCVYQISGLYRFSFGKEAAYTALTHTHTTEAKKTHCFFVSWILKKKKTGLMMFLAIKKDFCMLLKNSFNLKHRYTNQSVFQ